MKKELVKKAEAQKSKFPQYKGHWDGSQWEVARVTRPVKTRMGMAFDSGDLVLVDRSQPENGGGNRKNTIFVTAYSFRNKTDTSIPLKSLEF